MRWLLLAVALLAASCATPTVEALDSPIATPDPTSTLEPTSIPTYSAPTEYVPEPERTNWLLLGGDYRAHREGTGWGDKTDVMVLVSVLETDPVEITVVQFPRNLYVPSSLGDTWMFAVWDRGGYPGLRDYFDEVFGVDDLTGIFYINMDGFVTLVDGLGGLVPWGIDRMDHSGEGILEYLRDNDNNWGYATYDNQQRVFGVLRALVETIWIDLRDDPIGTMMLLLREYGDLVESDMTIQQYYWLAFVGAGVLGNQKEIRYIQLEQPYVIRGDTPIIQNEQPMRGLIPDYPLDDWMAECAFGGNCEP